MLPRPHEYTAPSAVRAYVNIEFKDCFNEYFEKKSVNTIIYFYKH